jgi:RNA polymerase sigma factor (sigma-70 family)
MQKVARGEQESFHALYQQHKGKVFGICLKMMGKGRGAEDMAQEVWMKIIKNATQYRPIASLNAWISQVTRNACLNELRVRHPEEFAEDLDAVADVSLDADQVYSQLTDHAVLEEAFKTLPSQQRAVLLMFVYEELSHAQIASELKISVGAVKQLLFRGKENLRAHFKVGP